MLFNDEDEEFNSGNYFTEYSDYNEFKVHKAKSNLASSIKR